MKQKVLLSFDVEEFDLPKEHGAKISVAEGARVSAEGLKKILDLLKKNNVKATFFCTGNFAKEQPQLIKRIFNEGHEVAGHGVDHFKPSSLDAKKCKKILEEMVPSKVVGYRQPRMQKINYKNLREWGYKYDSSVNPAFIPGRYNNLKVPRKAFMKDGVLEIPTSVATCMRVPMFWLALHLFPLRMYIQLARGALKKQGYFATYFHPWEFADLGKFDVVPWYIKKNSGEKLVKRLEKLIKGLKSSESEFVTYDEFAQNKYEN